MRERCSRPTLIYFAEAQQEKPAQSEDETEDALARFNHPNCIVICARCAAICLFETHAMRSSTDKAPLVNDNLHYSVSITKTPRDGSSGFPALLFMGWCNLARSHTFAQCSIFLHVSLCSTGRGEISRLAWRSEWPAGCCRSRCARPCVPRHVFSAVSMSQS